MEVELQFYGPVRAAVRRLRLRGNPNTPITRFENFNSGDLNNPCPAGQ
jgi:hypothetical protein